MRYRYQHILLLLMAVWMAGCQFRQDENVDFTDLTGAGNLTFRVIGQNERDLSEGIPSDCYLPDGTPVWEYSDAVESVPARAARQNPPVPVVPVRLPEQEYCKSCSNTETRTRLSRW